MLNYEFPPIGGGGGQAHLNLLVEYAKKKDLYIDVLTSSASPGNTIEPFSDNIALYKIGLHKKSLHFWRKVEVLEWLFKANIQLEKLLSENVYSLAHAFFGFPTGWLTYRHRKKQPYLVSLRGSDVPGGNPRLSRDYKLLGPLFRRIWKNADLLITNSNGLAQRAKNFAPLLDYGVIPNGVDSDRFVPVEQKPPMEPFMLLAVGRLTQVKRFDLAIRSICNARKMGVDVQLTIAGNGNLMAQLKQLARKLEIPEYIHFMDWVEPEKIPALYQGHHAFLLTSTHEGMSNAMLEAVASGLPIITTACEGTDELVRNNGMIVLEPTAKQIAKRVIEIVHNPSKYNQMANFSRKMAEKFSWGNTADRYLQLYKKYDLPCHSR
ncbi:MAG: glycosyltransferase family 4 protein [Planctomycetota bacterium]